jgi:hypothetical protein
MNVTSTATPRATTETMAQRRPTAQGPLVAGQTVVRLERVLPRGHEARDPGLDHLIAGRERDPEPAGHHHGATGQDEHVVVHEAVREGLVVRDRAARDRAARQHVERPLGKRRLVHLRGERGDEPVAAALQCGEVDPQVRDVGQRALHERGRPRVAVHELGYPDRLPQPFRVRDTRRQGQVPDALPRRKQLLAVGVQLGSWRGRAGAGPGLRTI